MKDRQAAMSEVSCVANSISTKWSCAELKKTDVELNTKFEVHVCM